jgi:MtrB/PioB family decaheme-associated outer membrane protein
MGIVMRTCTPSWLLLALGVVSLSAGRDALAADPSQWKCETCPFETANTHGTVDAGVGYNSDDSAKHADYTGLDQQGAFFVGNATLRSRGDDGYYSDFEATDLGLDDRSLSANGGRAGSWAYRLGYAEIPRHFADGAMTPYLGVGGNTLTLPPGYPAGTTAGMPLSSTLQPVDIGYTRKRLDLGGTLDGPDGWQFRVDARRDVRDGTQRSAGSFFSTTTQLVAPLDQTTDQLEAVAEYAGQRLQASFGYRGSMFHNGDDALTFQSPFTPLVAGATTGQLALAPDNEFHEVFGTLGYQFSPGLRASGELAVGRMTQNQSFLASTLNDSLVVPALPAASLDGQVDTLDATLRVTATPMNRMRLSASYTRNERDNKTDSLVYPQVATDMYVESPQANQPYSFTHDRGSLEGDWHGEGWKLASGLDYDSLKRTLQETGRTNETSVWARSSIQPSETFGMDLKLLLGDRHNDGYVTLPSATPDNPLMRKYNQADRRRTEAEMRADWTLKEGMTFGLNFDVTNDDYSNSDIGLTGSRSAGVGADFAYVTDNTQFRAYFQLEEIYSRMSNSQSFSVPDWSGNSQDAFNTLGVGVTHKAMGGKLEFAGDLAVSQGRSATTIWLGSFGTEFPVVRTALDSLTLSAVWHQSPKLSYLGSLALEHYDDNDWHLDGIGPGTVPNLLAFGEQPPRYNAAVVRIALRYAF